MSHFPLLVKEYNQMGKGYKSSLFRPVTFIGNLAAIEWCAAGTFITQTNPDKSLWNKDFYNVLKMRCVSVSF